MALLPGSPAIDAGNNALIPAGITTDQRGFTRIVNGTVDIGAFEVQRRSRFVVNTTADDGTPRQARPCARRSTWPMPCLALTTITFDPTVFADAQTITLTGGQLELSNTTGTETITGPAAGVTVSGGGLSRVFQVDSGVTASISGLTITGGSTTGNGGGLYNDGGTTTLTNCTVSGNSASATAAACSTARGTTTLTDCTVSGNSASANGGGLYNYRRHDHADQLHRQRQLRRHDGGGLFNYRGTTTLTNCTVSGNSASGRALPAAA